MVCCVGWRSVLPPRLTVNSWDVLRISWVTKGAQLDTAASAQIPVALTDEPPQNFTKTLPILYRILPKP